MKKKGKKVILTILVFLLIYNMPPVLISSEGIIIGKKLSGKEMSRLYNDAGAFSHVNHWEYFYFINTKPFNTVYVEEPYAKDINKGERISVFVYKIKNMHSDDLEKNSSIYKFIRNGNQYFFYYGISV